jgi:chromosome segregation ATPase
VGGTSSTIWSTTEARDFTRLLADYLEGLKDNEADQAGTHSSFAALSLRFFVLTLPCSRFIALTTELSAAKKVLSEEKATRSATDRARSAADRALAEEKATRQAADQSLLSSNETNVLLARELESTQASLTAISDKLSSKSSALDHAVIREQQMKIQLTACEEKMMVANDKLKDAEEKMKIQGQLLDSAQHMLSKWELSSSVVANAMALVKNDLPDLNIEILRRDFTVDDVEWETLVNIAYDAAHDFVSLYDFFSLAESDDNNSPKAL